MDLTTRYLGLTLAHPFMPGASPLADDLDTVRRLEDAGAAAIVLRSLFAEQIDARDRAADHYIEHVRRVAALVRVPVIASLNGTTADTWLKYARLIEMAGADALELNFYHVATDADEDGRTVEGRVLDIVAVLKESIHIPLAVKLTPFYSSVPHLARQLTNLGADGLVLFARSAQPEIDPEHMDETGYPELSTSAELPVRLRAIAALAGRVPASLAVTGGVHEPLDAIKATMAGADAVQVVSALYRYGPAHLDHLRRGFIRWCGEHECTDIADLRGCMSLARLADPSTFERAGYVRTLQTWRPSSSAARR